MMQPLVAKSLYRFFHNGDAETLALKGVDLTLEEGELVALVGPSGSGKSTLLACLAGLDTPDGGHVEVMGQMMARRSEQAKAQTRARHIGMLMQSGNLLDHLTVEQNVELQLFLAHKPGGKGIPELLDAIGIGHRRHALPMELSGGEASRAGLATAVAAQPSVLICDEPTAEVDEATEESIISLLRVQRERGVAVLVATHSARLAEVADRIVTIRDGGLL